MVCFISNDRTTGGRSQNVHYCIHSQIKKLSLRPQNVANFFFDFDFKISLLEEANDNTVYCNNFYNTLVLAYRQDCIHCAPWPGKCGSGGLMVVTTPFKSHEKTLWYLSS